jgi:hypothetical protein
MPSYPRMSGLPVGLLINVLAMRLQDGPKRFVGRRAASSMTLPIPPYLPWRRLAHGLQPRERTGVLPRLEAKASPAGGMHARWYQSAAIPPA